MFKRTYSKLQLKKCKHIVHVVANGGSIFNQTIQTLYFWIKLDTRITRTECFPIRSYYIVGKIWQQIITYLFVLPYKQITIRLLYVFSIHNDKIWNFVCENGATIRHRLKICTPYFHRLNCDGGLLRPEFKKSNMPSHSWSSPWSSRPLALAPSQTSKCSTRELPRL